MLAALIANAYTARAATVFVTTAQDENDAVGTSGAGLSLREALRDTPDGGDIGFANALNGAIITLGSEIVIEKNVVVDASTLSGGITIDGGPGTNRVFFMTGEKTIVLKALTLTGGDGTGTTSSSYGGAIYNEGSTVTLNHCTLWGNHAPFGGAIYNDFGSLTLSRCTLSSDSAFLGGAIYNVGVLKLTHCTLSGNSASNSGGAIYTFGTLSLTDCIVAGNIAPNGGDIFNDGSTIHRGGANIVQSNFNAFGATVTGVAAVMLPPRLAPLGKYGGPTMTMALLPGSPALEAAIVPEEPTMDQRGFPIVGAPDIGAYEAGTFTNYNAFIWEALPDTATAPERAPSFDFDGDNVTNANEWLSLTKPSDSTNYLRVTQLTRSNPNVTVSFPSVIGRYYTFESSSNMVTWTPIDGAPLPGTDSTLVIQLGPFPNAEKLFIRVRTGL